MTEMSKVTVIFIGLGWFLCLRVYQLLRVTWCQSHPCRKTVVKQFNPLLMYKTVHAFLKSINLKANVIVRLEFELTYYHVTVQHVSHNAMRIFPYPLKKWTRQTKFKPWTLLLVSYFGTDTFGKGLNSYPLLAWTLLVVSSSSCRAAGTDIPDPLSPLLGRVIVYRL